MENNHHNLFQCYCIPSGIVIKRFIAIFKVQCLINNFSNLALAFYWWFFQKRTLLTFLFFCLNSSQVFWTWDTLPFCQISPHCIIIPFLCHFIHILNCFLKLYLLCHPSPIFIPHLGHHHIWPSLLRKVQRFHIFCWLLCLSFLTRKSHLKAGCCYISI